MSVYVGIESGISQRLSTYKKGDTVHAAYRAIELLEGLTIRFEFGFLILNPDSTFESLREDIRFLKSVGSSGAAVVHFTKMVTYSGTPIAQRLAEEGQLTSGLEMPDYRYTDARLELLQHFFSIPFHHRYFDRNGSVEMLHHAKFDAIIARKFFSGRSSDEEYGSCIRALMQRSNEKATETMSIATSLMASRSEEEILRLWPFLERLTDQELSSEKEIKAYFRAVMSRFQ